MELPRQQRAHAGHSVSPGSRLLALVVATLPILVALVLLIIMVVRSG